MCFCFAVLRRVKMVKRIEVRWCLKEVLGVVTDVELEIYRHDFLLQRR
jgi:hypothetical protein